MKKDRWFKMLLEDGTVLDRYSDDEAYDWWHNHKKPGDKLIIVHYEENEVIDFTDPGMCRYYPF